MPRIGSGCDELDWTIVRAMNKFIFRSSNIEINIHSKMELTLKEKNQIIEEHHNNPLGGHRGPEQTIKRIKTQFDWNEIAQHVWEFVNRCPSCQVNKTENRNIKQPMVISTTSTEPFEKLFIDVVGPLPRTLDGNAYILTMQDDLTKFSVAEAMANHKTNTVAYHFVTSWVCLHGISKSIVSDQGTEFLSKVMTETCKLLKINKLNTSPYHTQANGAIERSHRTLGEYLRHYVDKNQANWDTYIPYAMFVFNSSEHRSTGKQPYQLLYRRTLTIPSVCTKAEEPVYIYEDYHWELKQRLLAAHAIAHERLKQQRTRLRRYTTGQ